MQAGSHYLRGQGPRAARELEGGCKHYPTVVLDAVKPGASYFWMPIRHSWAALAGTAGGQDSTPAPFWRLHGVSVQSKLPKRIEGLKRGPCTEPQVVEVTAGGPQISDSCAS